MGIIIYILIIFGLLLTLIIWTVRLFKLFSKGKKKSFAIQFSIWILLIWILGKDWNYLSEKTYSLDNQYSTYYETSSSPIIENLIPFFALPGTGGSRDNYISGDFYIYDEIEKIVIYKGYPGGGDWPYSEYEKDCFAKDSFNWMNVKIKLPRPILQEKKEEGEKELVENYDESNIIKEYYENTNILKAEFRQGYPGGCGAIVDFENTYYRSSKLKSKSLIEIDISKENNDGCHSLMFIKKFTEYFENGNEKISGSWKYGYETMECPCGIWKYYDKEGKLKETKGFGDCSDENFDCE